MNTIESIKDVVQIKLGGDWTKGNTGMRLDQVTEKLSPDTRVLRVSADCVEKWDSVLVSFLFQLHGLSAGRELALELQGFPAGVSELLDLATAVPPREGAGSTASSSLLGDIGNSALAIVQDAVEGVKFVGEVTLSLLRFVACKSMFSMKDLRDFLFQSGPSALGIVSLISLLVGLILAFVAAIQLRMFGAQVYVANLVGIAMVRALGAIMTGIVMAGRTGAAYAAQLGTMQVNEEIDAFKTMGIEPVDYLVLPRMLALVITMPLLCIYANVMGVLGGMVVGVSLLDVGIVSYWNQTVASIRMSDFWVGLTMSVVFGFLVSGAGCLRGLQCGRSSAEVGKATTSAVVTGVVLIVVATAVITFICDILRI